MILPRPYKDLNRQTLSRILKELKAFKETEAYQIFQQDFQRTKERAEESTELIPESVGVFFVREQAQGEVRLLRQVVKWHDSQIEKLENILTQIQENET